MNDWLAHGRDSSPPWATPPIRVTKVRAEVTLRRRARTTTELKVTAAADDSTRTCTRWMPDLFGGTGGSLILVAC